MERRSIQEYAEEYKNRLKAGEDLDFVAYCRSYGLRVDSVRQWMRRHGMDPKAIQLGIVLERYHCKQLEDQAVCQSVAEERRTHVRADRVVKLLLLSDKTFMM